MDPARAQAFQVALGGAATLQAGDSLPPFFHHLYFWEPVTPDGLGRDGHPRVGGLIPDMGLPRRMWAGGRLEFHGPLRLGAGAEKQSFCERADRKVGRSGDLGIVTLRHEISQGGVLRLTEWQDLVYRAEADATAPKPMAPAARTDEDSCRAVDFDATLLFRYSALTFNGHRIHYDQPYAREVEGYDGLVVHGPLLAQLLMLDAGAVKRFSYKATAPLMHHERAAICRKGSDLWVRGPDGRQCMLATSG
ncbi:hypothetical protein [Pseudosulfitobacter koreensis]|uniref:3-methylfumaryl-CoA hydratase n=1 Tax=Pseudosulfitobacter koreensis TaxID=2968472 RepID=A0ABT1YW33_9RHOB|nr:hypothetical protein [Pseudosulfitobacter koreense]MCR8825101.1 hypothetical protein [Pseudosulfitobacter koreense]